VGTEFQSCNFVHVSRERNAKFRVNLAHVTRMR
jgi:hypothetical protein